MTDLIDPATTAEIHSDLSAYHHVGEGTRRMPPAVATAPLSPIRFQAAEHAAIEVPQTIGIWPPDPVVAPTWAARVGEFPTVQPRDLGQLVRDYETTKPLGRRGGRRARSSSVWPAVGLGVLSLLGGILGGAVMLAYAVAVTR